MILSRCERFKQKLELFHLHEALDVHTFAIISEEQFTTYLYCSECGATFAQPRGMRGHMPVENMIQSSIWHSFQQLVGNDDERIDIATEFARHFRDTRDRKYNEERRAR